MKFRWRTESRWDRKKRWHRWFAWHPVQVGENEYRWLELVYRKGSRASYAKMCDMTGLTFEETYWSFEYKGIVSA